MPLSSQIPEMLKAETPSGQIILTLLIIWQQKEECFMILIELFLWKKFPIILLLTDNNNTLDKSG